jgi:hypothetical protein
LRSGSGERLLKSHASQKLSTEQTIGPAEDVNHSWLASTAMVISGHPPIQVNRTDVVDEWFRSAHFRVIHEQISATRTNHSRLAVKMIDHSLKPKLGQFNIIIQQSDVPRSALSKTTVHRANYANTLCIGNL